MICDRLWLIEDESDPADDLIALLLGKLNIFVEQRKGKLELDTGYQDFAISCIRFTVVYIKVK